MFQGEAIESYIILGNESVRCFGHWAAEVVALNQELSQDWEDGFHRKGPDSSTVAAFRDSSSSGAKFSLQP